VISDSREPALADVAGDGNTRFESGLRARHSARLTDLDRGLRMAPMSASDDLLPGRAEAFVDRAALAMAVREIRRARTSIDLEVFMLGGPLGRRVLRLLDRMARAGVRVSLLHRDGLSIASGHA
jgi:hypothetical protein